MVFITLFDLCLSPLTVELFVDTNGDYSVYFEDEGIGFQYKLIENGGIKGVDL